MIIPSHMAGTASTAARVEHDDAGADRVPLAHEGVDLLLDQHALNRTFDPLIIESIILPNMKGELAKREDVRSLPVITIDGLDAKDLDDAISIEHTEGG